MSTSRMLLRVQHITVVSEMFLLRHPGPGRGGSAGPGSGLGAPDDESDHAGDVSFSLDAWDDKARALGVSGLLSR